LPGREVPPFLKALRTAQVILHDNTDKTTFNFIKKLYQRKALLSINNPFRLKEKNGC
jgi:hypothetical protein